jgi:hypothetical protein
MGTYQLSSPLDSLNLLTHCAGQVSGVGVASALFQCTLSAELRKRIHGAGADEVRAFPFMRES